MSTRRKKGMKTGMEITELSVLHASARTKFSYNLNQLCPKENGATVWNLIKK